MLKKEVLVKVSVVTLRKKLAVQIPVRHELHQSEYKVVGWFASSVIGWCWLTGLVVLVLDTTRNDYAYVAGHRRPDDKLGFVATRFGEEVTEHIYIV